jgi:hypothetical protein
VVYCPQLWLAIERMKGFTLDSLWNVIPQNLTLKKLPNNK